MSYHPDTIAAIATPPGHGGIAIVRVSGPDAGGILSRLFRPADVSTWRGFIPRHLHYGHVFEPDGALLDEVLAVFMPGPASVTGEDVGELHCHGGLGVSAALLEAALECGARLAEAGEFTKRAFLNGRMDLTQAEAVNELIHASSREGARLAAAKLDGALGRQVGAVRAALLALRVRVTVSVDFPDEEASGVQPDVFARTVDEARDAVAGLLGSYERARLWREGALAVLVGRVNAGKSSLLNALVGRDRAIVSEAPGTTRDYIEESVSLGGVPVRLTDTAGLRAGGDAVEEEGIRRSRGLADAADLLLFVMDGNDLALSGEETDFLKKKAPLAEEGRLLLVVNKMDGPESGDPVRLLRDSGIIGASGNDGKSSTGDLGPDTPIFAISAKYGAGIDALCAGMRDALLGAERPGGDLAPNLRQSLLLRQALSELDALRDAFGAGETMDLLDFHLDAAAGALAGVTGVTGNDAVLDSIFDSFCIGK